MTTISSPNSHYCNAPGCFDGMLQCSSNILVKITAIKHFFIIILRHLAKIYPVQTFGISISKLKVLLRDQLILLLSKDALSLHQN